MKRRCCLGCGGSVKTVIELGMHPLADRFVRVEETHQPDFTWPLNVQLCETCGLLQNEIEIAPETRYVDHEYSFVSAHSKSNQRMWQELASELTRGRVRGKFLEFGSNDGFLCSTMKSKGWNVRGIEPSPHMCQISTQRGVPTERCFLQEYETSEKFDLLLGFNVFNHVNEPLSALKKLRQLVCDDGDIVIQVPDWLWLFSQRKYDQIYHEHVTHFTLKSFESLAFKCDLNIINVEETTMHGKSLRVTLSPTQKRTLDLKTRALAESAAGVFNASSYEEFQRHIRQERADVRQKIINLKFFNKKIFALGASAKGNTFLNFCGLSAADIDGVLDIDERKVGKLTPLSRIPIFEECVVKETQEQTAVLITTDTLPKQVISALKNDNNNIIFVDRSLI